MKRLDHEAEVWELSPQTYVVHFTTVPFPDEHKYPDVIQRIKHHLWHACHVLEGSEYTNSKFGGGVRFRTSNLDKTLKKAGVI